MTQRKERLFVSHARSSDFLSEGDTSTLLIGPVPGGETTEGKNRSVVFSRWEARLNLKREASQEATTAVFLRPDANTSISKRLADLQEFLFRFSLAALPKTVQEAQIHRNKRRRFAFQLLPSPLTRQAESSD